MEAATFSIDFIADKIFAGYTRGETWNGFSCPYFTFEQAQLLAGEWSKTGYTARYDATTDAFIFGVDTGGGPDQEDIDSFAAVEIAGTKYYPVGAGCWIWES